MNTTCPQGCVKPAKSPFETRDDFPPDLHDESVYYVSPPPNKPPFETADDFPPNLHDESVYYASSPTDEITDIKALPRSLPDDGLPFMQSVPQPNRLSNPARPIPMEYVEHPVAFVPSVTTSVIYAPESQTTPPSSPLDVTMLAMMGLTLAGAGMMKTQTVVAKQNEQATQQAQALAQLQAQQSAQKQVAQANWADNQAMQASAKQAVVTKVTQSQANIEFMDSHNRWYRESTIKNLLIQLQQSVTLDGIRNTVNQAWERYGSTQDAELGALLQYWMDTYGNIEGLLEEADIQDTDPFKTNMQNAFGYEIQWGNALSDNIVAQWKSLANLLASNLHIASYFNENILPSSSNTEPGLDVFRKYFAKIPDGTPVTLHIGDDSYTGGASMGRVNLPNSSSLIESDMFLGSEVTVATITHEFGHQFDRWFEMAGISEGIIGYLSQLNDDAVTQFTGLTGIGLDHSVYAFALNSFAGKQTAPQEIWSDIFMTAVLSPDVSIGHSFDPFTVYSFDFRHENNPFDVIDIVVLNNWIDEKQAIECGRNGINCDYFDVNWATVASGARTNNSISVENALWSINLPESSEGIFDYLFSFSPTNN